MMGKKKTKLSDKIALNDGLPDDIRSRLTIALRYLLEKYTHQEIKTFLDEYRHRPDCRTHPPHRGLNFFFKVDPSKQNAIPNDALSDVANLDKAYADAKFVLRHGIGEYLGPGAEKLHEYEQQKRRAKKNQGRKSLMRRAVELSGKRDLNELLEWFRDDDQMADLYQSADSERKIDVDIQEVQELGGGKGKVFYRLRDSKEKEISFKRLKEYLPKKKPRP
jgi:hypothetical protein